MLIVYFTEHCLCWSQANPFIAIVLLCPIKEAFTSDRRTRYHLFACLTSRVLHVTHSNTAAARFDVGYSTQVCGLLLREHAPGRTEHGDGVIIVDVLLFNRAQFKVGEASHAYFTLASTLSACYYVLHKEVAAYSRDNQSHYYYTGIERRSRPIKLNSILYNSDNLRVINHQYILARISSIQGLNQVLRAITRRYDNRRGHLIEPVCEIQNWVHITRHNHDVYRLVGTEGKHSAGVCPDRCLISGQVWCRAGVNIERYTNHLARCYFEEGVVGVGCSVLAIGRLQGPVTY